jgi:hypothetical protein
MCELQFKQRLFGRLQQYIGLERQFVQYTDGSKCTVRKVVVRQGKQ